MIGQEIELHSQQGNVRFLCACARAFAVCVLMKLAPDMMIPRSDPLLKLLTILYTTVHFYSISYIKEKLCVYVYIISVYVYNSSSTRLGDHIQK